MKEMRLEVDLPLIGIVGGTGKLGRWFKREFESVGIEVLVSGRNSELSSVDIVKKCDIVIVCVFIENTVQVIREIVPFMKDGSLITDFTSIKGFVVDGMKKVKESVGVLGMHPLFGPLEKDLNGQRVVFCRERDNVWVDFLKSFFEKKGVKIIEMNAVEHDRQMAIIQGMNSFVNLSFAKFASRYLQGLNPDLFTPMFRLQGITFGRMLSQSYDLYPNIQLRNDEFLKIVDEYLGCVNSLSEFVKGDDVKGYEDEVKRMKYYLDWFVEEKIEESKDVMKLLKGMGE